MIIPKWSAASFPSPRLVAILRLRAHSVLLFTYSYCDKRMCAGEIYVILHCRVIGWFVGRKKTRISNLLPFLILSLLTNFFCGEKDSIKVYL